MKEMMYKGRFMLVGEEHQQGQKCKKSQNLPATGDSNDKIPAKALPVSCKALGGCLPKAFLVSGTPLYRYLEPPCTRSLKTPIVRERACADARKPLPTGDI
jgi:hypothetical protein